jgi:DNA repair exonuclease SbcCD ATPase subunit
MLITRLELQSWKAFPQLDLKLGPGTTFLVARNAVGKTSIVQGLTFALFGRDVLIGSGSPVSAAIRAGQESAWVGCDLSVDNRPVRVERTITKNRHEPLQSGYWIDESVATEAAYFQLLRTHFGLDTPEIEMLTVVSEVASATGGDVGMEIAQSLSATFGVDRLRRASEEFESQGKRIDRETDDRRRLLRDTPLRKGTAQRADLKTRIEGTNGELSLLTAELEALDAAAELANRWTQYEAERLAYEAWSVSEAEALSGLLTGIREFVDVASLSRSGLPELRSQLASLVAETNQVVGRAQGFIAVTSGLLEQIEAGNGICPVCRRPLSSEEAAQARFGHEADLERFRSTETEAREKLSKLSELMSQCEALMTAQVISVPSIPNVPQPAQPDQPAVEAGRVRPILASKQASVRELESQLNELDIQESTLRGNEELSREFLNSYREAERSLIAAEVLDSLANTIMGHRIEPLARELQKRWLQIWGAEPMTMDELGNLTLDVSGTRVPYREFSGGQRTIANVIARILTLELAAARGIAVLDEPLEHLDPKNRRLLTSLLVKASQTPSRVEQILVTTYEETVTRRLSTVAGTDSKHTAQVAYLEPS